MEENLGSLKIMEICTHSLFHQPSLFAFLSSFLEGVKFLLIFSRASFTHLVHNSDKHYCNKTRPGND